MSAHQIAESQAAIVHVGNIISNMNEDLLLEQLNDWLKWRGFTLQDIQFDEDLVLYVTSKMAVGDDDSVQDKVTLPHKYQALRDRFTL